MSDAEFIQEFIGDKKSLLSALEKNISRIKKSFSVKIMVFKFTYNVAIELKNQTLNQYALN